MLFCLFKIIAQNNQSEQKNAHFSLKCAFFYLFICPLWRKMCNFAKNFAKTTSLVTCY